ncbi:acid beta-fructofuranosidase 2, vacuolar-like [Hibiscus syriacus]|uniref:acid beta-fructofuranosidase 2, vacuolar-like n=1 Tax=Hibiscus syriacus TaxID=106335 RepID=UPI001920D8DD|nr:acid beta-fructofuranosidase 2, vacuolar-like [Hibiscus syriacus]
MADTKPLLPAASDSDSSSETVSPINRLKPIKVYLTIFFGLLAAGLFAALLIGNHRSGSAHLRGNQNGSLASFASQKLKPQPLRPVSRGPAQGVSEKTSGIWANVPRDILPEPWNSSMLVWQRTAFHFQPEKNWMNDPNGPLFYNDWYHFFYQYNPIGAVWGNIVWGHAVSKDLINWFHLPLAMVADQWYDKDGVWTGSATILPDGKVVMLYTGSTAEAVQVQNLAYPANLSDPLLIKWVKYEGNPVLVPPPGIHKKDFRDPTTAWMTSEGKWRITIGSKINKTGISLVYDTKDFINYEMLPGVLHSVPGTGMWECVDFFPVSITGKKGLDTSVNGPEVKHVVKVSLDDDRHDYYAIGTYHEINGSWIPDEPEIDLGIGIRYDYGIFYASKTFYDQNKNRRILWGWIGETDSEVVDMEKGWASLQAIPRTILFDNKTGTNLLQWPVEETDNLRLNNTEFNKVSVETGSVVPLDVGPASQLDIIAEFDVDEEALKKANEVHVPFSCKTSGGAAERGALGPFGLLVLADESLSEQTPVYFYIAKGSDGKLNTFLCNDLSRSSKASDVDKQIFGNYVPVLEGEKLSLRILVDHSIIESFGQGGRTVITSRVYPTEAIYGAAKVFLFNNATETNVTASLKIWQMNSAVIGPYPVDDDEKDDDQKSLAPSSRFILCPINYIVSCLTFLYFISHIKI